MDTQIAVAKHGIDQLPRLRSVGFVHRGKLGMHLVSASENTLRHSVHRHVWTAPLVKGVLRLCERLGCGHVFGLFALGRETRWP
jgi:hypothetical protein